METRCVLCDEPMTLRAIGAMVLTGDVEHPDGDVLCRRCAALSPDEQKHRRDVAMARILREEMLATDESRSPRARHPVPERAE